MLDLGDDPEVFSRDRSGQLRQVDSASDADTILANFRGSPLMRFRIVYNGRLPAAGNKSTRLPEKWAIRRALHPQLAGLWETHPTLRGRAIYIPHATVSWMEIGVHDSLHSVKQAINAPIEVGGRRFTPLVRNSLDLACELDILFLRNDAPGGVVSPVGGDLDNRIKTLFDGLRMPEPNDMGLSREDDPEPFYCLLEDDALISSFTVRSDRLLLAPGEPPDRVVLVMEARVTATKLSALNLAYLTD